jgi:hypothetical protein
MNGLSIVRVRPSGLLGPEVQTNSELRAAMGLTALSSELSHRYLNVVDLKTG